MNKELAIRYYDLAKAKIKILYPRITPEELEDKIANELIQRLGDKEAAEILNLLFSDDFC